MPISTIRSLQNGFSTLYRQSHLGAGVKQDKPKIVATFAEKLFVGDDTWLGAFQSGFMCLITVGIGPLILWLTQTMDKAHGIDNRIRESKQKAELISAMGIDDSPDSPDVSHLYHLSMEDLHVLAASISALHAKKDQILTNHFKLGYLEAGTVLHQIDSNCSVRVNRFEVYLYIHNTNQKIQLMNTKDLLSCWKADLSSLYLNGLDLSRANLQNANLQGSSLSSSENSYERAHRTSLNGADLRGANMADVTIIGTTFTDAQFNGNENFTLALPDWSSAGENDLEQLLDRHLDHIANSESGSILTAIDSIPNQYTDLKLRLMHQLIESLANVDTSSVDEAMLDIWMNNAIYSKDKKVGEKILSIRAANANISALKVSSDIELQMLLNAVSAKGSNNSDKEKFMLDNNSFFVQLLALSIGHPNPDLKEQGVQLYHDYMNLDALKVYKPDTMIGMEEETTDDAIQNNLQEIRDIDEDDLAFVFFEKNITNNTNALIVSKTMINAMLKLDPSYNWGDVYLIKDGERTVVTDVEKAYEPFPLFVTKYRYQHQRASFPKLLDVIKLNSSNVGNNNNNNNNNKTSWWEEIKRMFSTNPENHTSKNDYTSLFTYATKQKSSNTKLIDVSHQLTLNEIFSPLLKTNNDGVITDLTNIHYQQICTIYELVGIDKKIQAQTLLCLAAVFVTYSSSYFFGTEGDSPNALRNYAVGLLKRAYKLDSTVFVDRRNVNQFTDWINRLTGQGNAFQCTAVLRKKITDHANAMGFGHIMGAIKPPAW